jgi:hypothetical protein
MEFTDRERRTLAELERQFTTGRARRPPPPPATLRPRWTLRASAVLGFLLIVSGAVLGVHSAVPAGSLLLAWWLGPRLPVLLRRTGRLLAGSPPPDAATG